jgi:hypothetical protein
VAALTRAGFLEKGQAVAEDFVRHGVETWQADGHIDRARADQLMATLNAPEVETGMLHIGAHFAISLPLRFPFGGTARFFYTLGLRLRAEGRALLRRGSARDARRMHTFLVMLVSLLPGFGRLGYFFAPALREERLLLVIPLDQVSRKLPFRVYSRFHLDALFLYWGLGDDREHRLRLLDRQSLRDLGVRLVGLKPYFKPTAALLVVDAIILLVGAYIYLDAGRPEEPLWWWREGGLIATLDAAQLLAASVCGFAAYFTFWERRADASRSEAAGIFFWAIGAVGLAIFALDDYFTVHERLGEWLVDQLHFVPVVTNISGDMLIIGYAVGGLATISLFRMEVFSGRPSATLLQLAALSAIVMVAVDGFATTEVLKALEFPTQTFACSLLMLAFFVRWLEVRQASGAAAGLQFSRAGCES